MRYQKGVTLLELMVALAIMAIVSTIGYQLYTGYVDSADESVLAQNIDSMRIFQEDVRLRRGSYADGTWDRAGGDTSLQAAIGWAPDDPDDDVVYVVETVASGAGWEATATAADGTEVTRCFGDGCP